MKEIFTDQEKVQILADLVAVKSVNDHELQVAKYLQRLFAKYGITAKLLPLAANRAGAKLKLDIYMSQPSIQTTGDSRFVHLAQQIGSQYAGQAVPTFALNPVTDASNLVVDKGPQFPLAVFGPGNDTPHQVNEYADRQMYLNFINLYTKLFTTYLDFSAQG